MLLIDPLPLIQALAFADNAFENIFKSPEDIYKLVMPAGSDRLRLPWKEEWRKRPVFRDVEATELGIQIALDKALRYQTERNHLIRLGRGIGIAKQLEWYDLRRGSGKKLNGKRSSDLRESPANVWSHRGTHPGRAEQDYGPSARGLQSLRRVLYVYV